MKAQRSVKMQFRMSPALEAMGTFCMVVWYALPILDALSMLVCTVYVGFHYLCRNALSMLDALSMLVCSICAIVLMQHSNRKTSS